MLKKEKGKQLTSEKLEGYGISESEHGDLIEYLKLKNYIGEDNCVIDQKIVRWDALTDLLVINWCKQENDKINS